VKAVVAYGREDLRVVDVAEPSCGPGQVAVAVEYGGICGSDLHYWRHGAVGTSVLREPMILGHEVAGRIRGLGAGVRALRAGDSVTVHPARPCGTCVECGRQRPHLCRNVAHLGSAARLPHTDGAFCETVVVQAEQVRLLPDGLPTRIAATAEPLAVALHATNRAGDLRGRTVLVNGAGPIGCLLVATAVRAGASHVCVSDLADAALELAGSMGAHDSVNVTTAKLPADVDVVFEVSAAPAALGPCLDAVAKGGTLVQVGMLPRTEVPVDLSRLVTKEIDYLGSMRFVDEITDAVQALAGGLDVEPLLTHTFPVDETHAAFETALDPSVAGKVLLSFR
jgi:L-idonate 5-dehydrogenase